jgi:uncharacterized tellurite resistance protein B-like protein
MEILLVILAFIFGPMIFSALFSSGSKATQKVVVKARHGNLALRIRQKEITADDGDSMSFLVMEMKGMNPSLPGSSIGILHIEDVAGHPVQCLDPKRQEPGTVCYHEVVKVAEEVFRFEKDTYFTDWVIIGFLPLPFAIPAHPGVNQLNARLSLHPIACEGDIPIYREGKLTSGSHAAKTIISELLTVKLEHGYLAIKKERKRSIIAAMKLAVVVAAVDGSITKDELEVIRTAAKRRIESDSGDADGFKEDVQNAIRDTLSAVKENTPLSSIRDQSIQELRTIDKEPLSIEAIELCVEVLAADGEADSSELEMVYCLCEELGVDRDLVREMLGKKVAAEDLLISHEASDFSVLGIDESMGAEEAQRIINQAYRKWNSLIHHDNPQTASKAREMLELIGRARMELVT